MLNRKPNVDFQGLKKWMKQGEYIVSTIADDGTIWTYTTTSMPIFNFGTTKIFQAQESGAAAGREVLPRPQGRGQRRRTRRRILLLDSGYSGAEDLRLRVSGRSMTQDEVLAAGLSRGYGPSPWPASAR
jgi:hypothetical protein